MTRTLILIAMSLSLTACTGGDMSDLEEIVNSPPDRKGRVEALPEPVKVEMDVYRGYDAKGAPLRDPFLSFAEERRRQQAHEVEAGPRPDQNRPRETLENYDIEQLTLVGVVRDREGKPWGMVKASDGNVYKVTVGNYLGRNDGEIVEIVERSGESFLRIKELIPSRRGGYEPHEQLLEMIKL